MNTKAIIEKLLQTRDERILNTPLDDLNLAPEVHQSLWRLGLRTVRDLAESWTDTLSASNIGERAFCEILGALQEWCRSNSDFTNPATAETRSDAAGLEPVHETLPKKYVMTGSGFIVNVDLLQEETPRTPRQERWRNTSPTRQEYVLKNTFQAINGEQNKISDPVQKWVKSLKASDRKNINLLRPLLETLEKANRPRKARMVRCSLCRAVMQSIRFEQHVVALHPEEFRELQKTVSSSAAWQNVPGVGLVFRDPLQGNQSVKCPLCEHTTLYKSLQDHFRNVHPEVDSGLMMKRFGRANRCRDYQSLLMYQAELNEMIREYERLKQAGSALDRVLRAARPDTR